MHLARRTPQPNDPHTDEAVHPTVPGLSKKLENLEATCAMFLAYYNFVRRTRLPGKGRYRPPAATAAGVVATLRSFEDLFDAVRRDGYAIAA